MMAASVARAFLLTALLASTTCVAFVASSQHRQLSALQQPHSSPPSTLQSTAIGIYASALAISRHNVSSTSHSNLASKSHNITVLQSRSFEMAHSQVFYRHSWVVTVGLVLVAIAACFALGPSAVPDGGIATIRAAAARADTQYSLWECSQRLLRIFTLYYWTIITGPVAWVFAMCKLSFWDARCAPLLVITFWIRLCFALIMIVISPFIPVTVSFFSLVNMWKPMAWWAQDQGEGLENDARPFARFIHMCFIQMAVLMVNHYTGEGMLSRDQINTTFSKDFWRRILTESGCAVPAELGRMPRGEKTIKWKGTLGKQDVVLKEESGALGKGDGYLVYGTDFEDEAGVEKALQAKSTTGCPDILLLQRAYPRRDLGVHCLRIITAKDSSGKVCVLWTAIQIDSQTWTSHNGKHQNYIDGKSETIVQRDQWFRNRATWEFDEAVKGKQLPGVQKACEAAIKAHETALKEQPTRYFVGWDCMWTEDGGLVWFEGNTVQVRLGRVIFASWETVFAFMWNFAWPMGPTAFGFLGGRNS